MGRVARPPLGVLARYSDVELVFIIDLGFAVFSGRAVSGSMTSILKSVILSQAAFLEFLIEQLHGQMTSNFHRMTSYPFRICHVNVSCQLRDLSGYLFSFKKATQAQMDR